MSVNLDEQLKQMREQIKQIRAQLEKTNQEFSELLQTNFYQSIWKNIKKDEIKSFVKRPYLIKPVKEDEWQLAVPLFLPLEVGWLEYQTDSFNVFRINKFVDWLTPIPEILKDELGIEKPRCN